MSTVILLLCKDSLHHSVMEMEQPVQKIVVHDFGDKGNGIFIQLKILLKKL